MSIDPVDLAQASYARCCDVPDFFSKFYAELFATCPAARPMFASTDFERQHRLVKHGIGLLINYNHESDGEPNILTRVAERHRRGDLGVHPSMYRFFVESFITVARQHDPHFDAATEAAWRTATAKGIEYMGSKY
jgi:eukaryotic-like serine/threonine-protein kinase